MCIFWELQWNMSKKHRLESGLELQFELCKNGYSRSSSPLSYTRAAFQQRTENPCFLPSFFRLFIQPRMMGVVRRIKIICKKSVANCMCMAHWCISWMLDWRTWKWIQKKNIKVSLSFGRRQVGVTALQVLCLSVAISGAWMSVEEAFQAAEI